MLDLGGGPSLKLIALWADFLAYGIYVVLFWVCMYLYRSYKRSDHGITISAVIALFVLCTVKLILDVGAVLLSFGDVTLQLKGYDIERGAKYIYTVTNVIADSLLIYRCYVIWDSRKSVIVAPILMLLLATVMAFVLYPVSALITYLTLATNVLVTALSAGRIWWINRRLSNFLGPKIYSKYTAILALLIESALLYPMSLVLFSIAMMLDPTASSMAYWMSYYLVSNVVGIAPTLLLVRIGLGTDVYNQRTISALESDRMRSSTLTIPQNCNISPGPVTTPGQPPV